MHWPMNFLRPWHRHGPNPHESYTAALERPSRNVAMSPEAINHYIKAGEYEAAARLLDEIHEPLFLRGNWQSLSSWIDALPQGVLDEHPWLLVCQASIASETGNLDRALEHCDRADELFSNGKDIEGTTHALLAKSVALRYKGLFDEAISVSYQALVNTSRSNGNKNNRTRAHAFKNIGLSLYRKGEFEQALEPLNKAVQTYELLGDTYRTAETHDVLGQIHGLRAHYPEAISHFELARQCWSKLGNQKSLAEVLNNIGVLYHLQGDLELAYETLQQSLRVAKDSQILKPQAYALASLAEVKRDAGDLTEALKLYQEALEKARSAEQAPFVPYLIDALATVYRLAGQMEKAETLARQSIYQGTSLSHYEEGLYKRSLGAILCEAGRYGEAAPLLEEACSLLAKTNVPVESAKAEFLHAYLCFREEKLEDCAVHLKELVKLTEGIQHTTFLLAEARGKLELVEFALSQGIGERWFYPLMNRVRNVKLAVEEPAVQSGQEEPPQVDGYALGECRVVLDGREIPGRAWETKTALQLLFFMLYNSRELRKEEIIEAMWPDCSPEKGHSSLQSTIYRIRRALYKDCVVARRSRYSLNPKGHFGLDAREFNRLAQSANMNGTPQETRLSILEEAARLYKGRFLVDFDADWIDTTQRELHNSYLSILSELCRHHMETHQYQDVVRTASLVLEEEPYSDEALRFVMQAHSHLGDREAAIRAYRQYSSQVRDELGVIPSQEVDRVYQAILVGP